MASASSLLGLIKFLSRDEWREPFEETLDAHFLVACDDAGIDGGDIADILGKHHAMTLWGCAFEDFLARDLPGGRNLVDDYLRRRSYKESASAKAYMKAIRCSVMSLYEVSSIVPGESFLARDLICGGAPIHVRERTATTLLKPWDRIGARVVPLAGGHEMCGGVLRYDFDTAEELLAELRYFETTVAKELHNIADEIDCDLDPQRLVIKSGALLELTAPIFTRLWLVDALDGVLNPRRRAWTARQPARAASVADGALRETPN